MTAGGRCTAAGASSTTSSSWPCRSWPSAACDSRSTPSSSRRTTGRTSSTAPVALRRARAARRGRPCGSTRRSRTSTPISIRCACRKLTLGVEHQLSPHVAVSARFVHKQLDKAVEDIGSVDAEGNATYVIGNPGYHRATEAIPGVPFPKAVRDYDAVELVARKAARPQLGAHRELRLEPLVRQLLGPFASRTRTDAPSRTSEGPSTPRSRCSTTTVEHSTGGWRPTVLTRPRRSSSTPRRSASTSASSSRWPAGCR